MTFQTLMTLRKRTYQGILQIMAFFPCKSSIISLIYDLVKVWYVLRWHQATTSAVRYGTTKALSRFLNSSFCHNRWNISPAVEIGQFKKEISYVMNTKNNWLELIYDLVKVWYVLRWHQATTSAVRYGTTSALSRFLNSSFLKILT